ncbi:unnamed protein product [Closterium sp. NIES-53]
MDVLGPARVRRQTRERYLLLVVDDYKRYTTVFPLRSKGQVVDVLIPWIRTVRLQLRERFGQDFPALRLHSDRGGEFSSNFLWDFCHGEGILQSFTLPDSPQQNAIAERRIGLVMEVACTSMIHAAAPHFLWPFAVWYAAHQLNLWPRVSLPETSPTLRWMGAVGDASVFRFYHPTSRLVFLSQDITFDESVPFYRLFPYRSAPPPPPPLFLAPGPPLLSAQVLIEVLCLRVLRLGVRISGGAESEGGEIGGAELGGVETRGAEPGGAEPGGVGPGGAASEGAESGGADPQGVASSGGSTGGGVVAGAGVTGGTATTSPRGPRTRGIGAARTGGVEGTGAGDPTESGAFAGGGSGTERREPASRPVSPVRTARRVPRLRPPPVVGTHTMALRPSSVPLRVPLPSPPESSLPEVPDPESDCACAASPTVSCLLAFAVADHSFESAAASALDVEMLDFAAACRLDYTTALVAESTSANPPSVGGECALSTNVLEDRQEDFECLVAAGPRFASMLLAPEGDVDAPKIPTPRSYAEAITGPYSSQWQAAMDAEMASWKSTGTYVDKVPPPGANIVDGMWIFRRDYELHSLDFNTAFLQGGLQKEIWLRLPPSFTESFPAGTQWSLQRPVYGLRQAPLEWHDTLRTTLAALGFAPAIADPSLFLRTDTSLLPFYILAYVDDLVFATADTEALTLVKSELQKRHTCTDLGELRSYLGLQITWDRAWHNITLTQSHMVHQVLQRFRFQFSFSLPTPLSTSHSLSAPPSDESVEPCGLYPELVGCLMHRKVHKDAAKRVLRYLCSTSGMGLVLGGWGPVVLTSHADVSWVDDSATQRSSQVYTFSLGSGSVSWWSTRSSLVLSSGCEAEIYARAMAAQELRWLTYLLTDLGEQSRSPPVLYVDYKAMIALCQEHRLEHRTKHVALRYFLARELQQRGQLRLAYVATRANTADIFTKLLLPGDHQRFSAVLGLLALLFLAGLVTTCSPPLCL